MGTCQGLISVSLSCWVCSSAIPGDFPGVIPDYPKWVSPRNARLDEEEILSVTFPQTQPLFWSNLPMLPTLPRDGKLWKLIPGRGEKRKEESSKEQNSPKSVTLEQSSLAGTECHLPIPRGLASLQSCDLIPTTFPELPCLIPKSASWGGPCRHLPLPWN